MIIFVNFFLKTVKKIFLAQSGVRNNLSLTVVPEYKKSLKGIESVPVNIIQYPTVNLYNFSISFIVRMECL